MTTKKNTHYRICSVKIQNVKGIEIFDEVFDEDFIEIQGANGAGKSSAIDSIYYAFKGEKPEKVIRKGATFAETTVDIRSHIINRFWREGQPAQLKIVSKIDGKQIVGKKQGFLEKIKSKLMFDPLAFSRMDKKERMDIFRQVVNLDFTDEDATYQGAYDKRRDINRDLEKAKKALTDYADVTETDEPARPIEIVQAEWQEITDYNKTIDDAKEIISTRKERVVEINEKLKELQAERAECQKVIRSNQVNADAKEEDIAPIEAELKIVREQADLQYKIKRKKELIVERDATQKKSDALTKKMDKIQANKKDKIETAKMPMPGMTMDGENIYVNGISFEEISQAQQIEASMAMHVAMKPELRVIFIKDGSLLDKTTKANMAAMAKKHDFMVILENVSETRKKVDTGQVIHITDGRVTGKKNNSK